ncbi:MAG: MFS transporter [Rhodospirillaceae bacterium]
MSTPSTPNAVPSGPQNANHWPVWLLPAVLVTAGAIILGLNLGVRQSMGLFIPDMAADLGWSTAVFGLAFAIQNLLWGLGSPVAGMMADRWGTAKTLMLGTALYGAGLLLMADVASPLGLHATAGVLIGLGVAGTTFPVVLGAVGRMVSPERRSLALGIVSAGGSFGQFVMAPITESLNSSLGWAGALVALAAICMLMIPCGLMLADRTRKTSAEPDQTAKAEAPAEQEQTLKEAFALAFANRNYNLVTLGFFVCGFHIAFIAVHLPVYVATCGLPSSVAAATLAVVGLFNIFGTLLAGWAGGRYRKGPALSVIYGLRAIVILAFMIAPKTEVTFLIFGAAIGMLWLSTVPLTSGIVAQVFGPRYMASLFGMCLLSHQIGAFIGSWAGGIVFEETGSYDAIWIASIILGIAAAIVNLPVREDKAVPKTAAAAA